MPIENGEFVLKVSAFSSLSGKLTDEDYKLLLDSYTGLGGFKDGSYLVRHKRETDDKYERRQRLAVYPNYVKKIVDTWTALLFKRPPRRQLPKDAEEYERFCQSADGSGTYIDDFMRRVFRLSAIYGTVFVVVDKPRGEARTKLEELERGLFPYASVRLPTQLHSYELDELGRLRAVVFTEKRGKKVYLRRFTPEGWELTTLFGDVVDGGEYALGRLPVVAVSLTERLVAGQLVAPPVIWDIARLNFEVYNLISEIREILRNQTFPILILPATNPEEENKYRNLTVSTENALLYNPEKGGKPDFIAPPPAPVEAYMEYLKLTIEQIYKAANLEFVLGAQTQRSGVALEFEFQNLNAQLAQFAMALEQAEYEIAQLVARWEGREKFGGVIDYAKDFSYRDAERQLKLALDALTVNVSRLFEIETKKLISRLILNDFSDDETLKRIDEEIEGLEGIEERLRRE